jgi:hypothetical protein
MWCYDSHVDGKLRHILKSYLPFFAFGPAPEHIAESDPEYYKEISENFKKFSAFVYHEIYDLVNKYDLYQVDEKEELPIHNLKTGKNSICINVDNMMHGLSNVDKNFSESGYTVDGIKKTTTGIIPLYSVKINNFLSILFKDKEFEKNSWHPKARTWVKKDPRKITYLEKNSCYLIQDKFEIEKYAINLFYPEAVDFLLDLVEASNDARDKMRSTENIPVHPRYFEIAEDFLSFSLDYCQFQIYYADPNDEFFAKTENQSQLLVMLKNHLNYMFIDDTSPYTRNKYQDKLPVIRDRQTEDFKYLCKKCGFQTMKNFDIFELSNLIGEFIDIEKNILK